MFSSTKGSYQISITSQVVISLADVCCEKNVTLLIKMCSNWTGYSAEAATVNTTVAGSSHGQCDMSSVSSFREGNALHCVAQRPGH